jgi:hypothetical protein
MEVDKFNFSESLPLLESALKECDFVGIDTEFTGNLMINVNVIDQY